MSEKIDMFQPPLGGPSEKEISDAKAVLDAHLNAVVERNKGTLIRCTSQIATGKGCGELHPISTLEYIQTHWYVSPHGCTGGDYWKESEGQWICPSCGHRNRLYASPEIEDLKSSFASVVKVHED